MMSFGEIALILALLVFIIAIFYTWLFEKSIARRIKALQKVMTDAKRGSFLVRAKVDKADEIGNLARSCNELLIAITDLQVRELEIEQDLQEAHGQLSTKVQLEEKTRQLKESHEALQRRVKAQELLIEVAHQVSGTLNRDELLSRLVTLVRDKLGWADFAVFWVKDDEHEKPCLTLAIASGLPDIDIVRSIKFKPGEGITGLVAQSGTPLVVGDLAVETRIKLREYVKENHSIPDFLYHGSMLSVPMICQNKVIGVMDFFHPSKNAFDRDDVALLQALGTQVAVAIVNAELYRETLELTIHDPLTGAVNRREMERRIAHEIARSQRYDAALSLLMVDIDFFKLFNDRMGHVSGDCALKEVAIKIQTSIREVDSVARFGGEEFCVILPKTTAEEGLFVAEKLVSIIREIELEGANLQPFGSLSISVGVASYPEHIPQKITRGVVIELIDAADRALYAAKKAGRNRAKIFTG